MITDAGGMRAGMARVNRRKTSLMTSMHRTGTVSRAQHAGGAHQAQQAQ